MTSNNKCDIIQDLLPLYQDNICSEESKRLVKEHLEECEECRKMVECLGNEEVEERLLLEKKEILRNHAKREKKRSTVVGMVTAGVLLIPVVVCLICNIAVGKALDWFYIVVSSLLVFASVTVVPMLKEKNKWMWTIVSFVVTLVLLLGVICLYVHGNWFFLATVPTLFGFLVLVLPYLLSHIALPKGVQNSKGVIYMTVNTLTTYLLIWFFSLYSKSAIYNRVAYGSTTIGLVCAWIIFITIRYLKISPLCKAGIVTIEVGIFTPIVQQLVDYLIYDCNTGLFRGLNLLSWNANNVNANISLLILAICVITGFFLIIIGSRRNEK